MRAPVALILTLCSPRVSIPSLTHSMGRARFKIDDAERRRRDCERKKKAYAANPKKYRAKARDYYHASEEHAETIKARAKKFREMNVERCKMVGKKYRLEHEDEIRDYRANRYQENREQILIESRERSAAGAAAVDALKQRLGQTCVDAQCTVSWHFCEIDHTRSSTKGAEFSTLRSQVQVDIELAANTDSDGTIHLQLLCPNHHRIRSGYTEIAGTPGSARAYFNQWRRSADGCGGCGIRHPDLPIFCFDADHRDEHRSVKECKVSILVHSGDLDGVKEELKLCRLLCATCHRKRTHIQLGWRHAAIAHKVPRGTSARAHTRPTLLHPRTAMRTAVRQLSSYVADHVA
jgi:hypothetical protein